MEKKNYAISHSVLLSECDVEQTRKMVVKLFKSTSFAFEILFQNLEVPFQEKDILRITIHTEKAEYEVNFK